MLKLTGVTLADVEPNTPTLNFEFKVAHNVGALRTVIDAMLKVSVDRRTGLASASMLVDGLTADSLDAARLKLANWCARLSVALAHADRIPGDVPSYETPSFDLATQPSWVQAEFARLKPRFAACALPGAQETSGEILKEMIAENNPLVNISDAYDQLQQFSYSDD